MTFRFDEIWIDEDALKEPLTREVLGRTGNARVLSGPEIDAAAASLLLEPDPLKRGKRILRLMKYRGAFVKPCPGTRKYVCCGLRIINIGQGCPIDCRYCALQVYFNRPVIELFVNTGDIMDEVRERLDSERSKFHRFCTGEFTDSLALDHLTGLAGDLVTLIAERPNASLELKTKTDFVDPLLDLDPRGRVVLSFSVNSSRIVRTEEYRATSLHARIAAAARAGSAGYRVGFHFDPIIALPDLQDEYADTVREIFSAVDPATIAWISLGVLRFVPELKETVDSRFGPVPYFHDGFLRGRDGKSRLRADRRISAYRAVANAIRSHAPDARIYLCMESPYVWEHSLGIRMESDEALSEYLDEAVR
jgi:spore photoproduct lyase